MELDYEKAINLDAEDLAEQGIKEAYDSLLPHLRAYVPEPLGMDERFDPDAPSYVVLAGGKEYPVYWPGTEDASWARAAFVLFSIVNGQLAHSDRRLYAIGGGNDLFGMFLTQAEAAAARTSLPRRTDWPYIPTDEPLWGGQFHDDEEDDA